MSTFPLKKRTTAQSNNIKFILKKVVVEIFNINLAQCTVLFSCDVGDEPTVFIKGRQFLDR
jgi:hypothetical protein